MAADHGRDAQDVPQVLVDLPRLGVGVNRPVRDATRDLVVVVALWVRAAEEDKSKRKSQSVNQQRWDREREQCRHKTRERDARKPARYEACIWLYIHRCALGKQSTLLANTQYERNTRS